MDTKKYRTRQEFRTCPNPKGKDYIVALDVGYSGTKVFHEGGCFCIPSYAKKIENGMLNVPNEKDILYRDNDTEELYMVGYNAQDMMDNISTNDTDGELYSRKRYGNKRFKIICNTAIALAVMNKKDNRKIVLQTGLPSSYTEADTPAITKALAKAAKFSIKIGDGSWMNFDFAINEADIFVMPQPSGALYSVLIKSDGNDAPDSKQMLCSNVLVMDIGFGTFDFFGIKNRSIECRESIDEIGMRQVFSKISKKILKETNEDIRVAALQKNMESGKFVCINEDEMKAEERSIAPFLQEANKETLAEAMEQAKSVTNAFRGYKYLIISGGTGEAWMEDIKQWLSGMQTLTILPGNINDHLPMIYSNVRGYYLFRYKVNGRR